MFEPSDLHYADLVAAARGFDQVIVWEGLPGPTEPKTRAWEIATQKIFWVGAQCFYDQPLPFIPAQAAEVSAAVLATKSDFEPWGGPSLCCTFHADYAVEWRRQGRTLARALFCFTCQEGLFQVGDRLEYVDLSPKGFRTFRILLGSHHHKRPPIAYLDRPTMPPLEAPEEDRPAPPQPVMPRPSPVGAGF
jgi:hypothetical protein